MLQVDVTSGGLDRHWAIINCMTRKTPDWIRPKSLLTNKVRQIHHEFPQRAGYDENILRSSKWSPWNAPKMTVKRRRCKGYQRNRSFLAEKKKGVQYPMNPRPGVELVPGDCKKKRFHGLVETSKAPAQDSECSNWKAQEPLAEYLNVYKWHEKIGSYDTVYTIIC